MFHPPRGRRRRGRGARQARPRAAHDHARHAAAGHHDARRLHAAEDLHDASRAHRATAQKKLDALVARAGSAGVRARKLLLEGQRADRILRAAKGAGLLVIGTRGRTGLARFILGSMASRVVVGARCPVVTVRGR
jgi:nucleotide-binding universal stress UspA family protein